MVQVRLNPHFDDFSRTSLDAQVKFQGLPWQQLQAAGVTLELDEAPWEKVWRKRGITMKDYGKYWKLMDF